MRWKGAHPTVQRLPASYARSVCVPLREMKSWEARLDRSATLPKYDVLIRPKKPRGR